VRQETGLAGRVKAWLGGVGAVDVAHVLWKIALWRLHQQMIMVSHQAPAVNHCPVTNDRRLQIGEKFLPVALALENFSLFVTPRCDMVESARIIDS
jgi:hypothetical protein